jgi:hypothetical protein
MHDESEKSFESCEKKLLLKNIPAPIKAYDVERFAYFLTQMFPISTINKSEGVWLITFSSNLSNCFLFNIDKKMLIFIIFGKKLTFLASRGTQKNYFPIEMRKANKIQ